MTCAICGDRAIGFNYDVLSCASCKAFFRRNANQTADRIRCLTGRGDCSVAHETRRKCQKCRLEKCFAMGMRKDFILSEEEKQYRKKRLEENRNVTTQRLSTTDSTSSSSVSNILSNPSSASPETDDLSQVSYFESNSFNIRCSFLVIVECK
jgi:nuclear receptor subfamily 1 group I